MKTIIPLRLSYAVLIITVLISQLSPAHAKGKKHKQKLKTKELFTSVKVTPTRVDIKIDKQFKKKYLTDDHFFAEYQPDVDLTKQPLSLALMPATLNLVSIVWASNKKYTIESMDAELFQALKKIKRIFKKLYPKTRWDGELVPRRIEHINAPLRVNSKTHTALFMSGGLDSIVSSFRHADKKQLLITVWGNTDYPPNRPDIWLSGQTHLQNFANQYGHEFAYVRSNFWYILNRKYLDHNISSEITSWRLDAVEGLGWAGLAAPILYAKGYPIIRIASSISWEFPARIASNPLIDDTIKFAGIQMRQDAFELDRIQKFQFLREFCDTHDIEIPKLRVCSSIGGQNCNSCIKCLQTITEALVAGENPHDYGFNITEDELASRMEKKIAKKKYSKRRIWHFWSIQKRLNERIAQGETFSNYLTWIAKKPIPYKSEVNWRTFMASFGYTHPSEKISPKF